MPFLLGVLLLLCIAGALGFHMPPPMRALVRKRASDGEEDLPSDVVMESAPPTPAMDPSDTSSPATEPVQITLLKKRLLALAARSNRGEIGDVRDIAVEYITELEALNPALNAPAGGEGQGATHTCMDGDWELVYTDTQLFSASPFFLTLREFFGFNVDEVGFCLMPSP